MSVRLALIVLNIIVFAGLAIYAIMALLSPKGSRDEKSPPNRTPFYDDDTLEGRRLERVLGWGLLFAGVIAVAFPLYWLREPTRQEQSETYFEDGSVERGATLYANAQSEAYDATRSLQCANCHGSDGGGGQANFTVDPDGPNGPAEPEPVVWKAPALNTVFFRFSDEEVNNIITYGRPGTPMQPWGVAGGGPKNEQAIEDLISFLRTIQLSPGDAQKQAAEELAAARTAADDQVSAAQEDLDAKRKALGDAEDELRKIVGDPNADEATLSQDCVDLREQIRSDPDAVDRDEAKACATYTKALAERDDAVEALDWARRWAASRGDVTDGQLLFELFCARCHTEGWSVFNPAEPNGTRFLGLAGGGGGAGGGIGFNLRDGAPQRRFGEGSTGAQAQVDFVTSGSEANKAYGRNGQGSGRMPGFAQMLTKDMIEQIVEYEREGLDATEFVAPSTTEESSR